MRVAGIMSGTSLDGIDVAVVELPAIRTVEVCFDALPGEDAGATDGGLECVTHTAEISRLNYQVAELYAKAVKKVGKVDLIGCHGQTIYHEGPKNTLQIGEAAVMAERTGIPVVSDFRARDIAAGGHGAPLVPFVDYLLFRHRSRTRVALNIGGIANITVIPGGARPEDVRAFDTGPGNMVMDALAREYSGGKSGYDRGGKLAAAGKVDRALLDELLRDAYYRKRPPKSAGREQYGAEFVDRMKRSGGALPDLIATATVSTAATIGIAVNQLVKGPLDLIVSGGARTIRRSWAIWRRFCHRRGSRARATTESTWTLKKRSRSRFWPTKRGAADRRTCPRRQAPDGRFCWEALRRRAFRPSCKRILCRNPNKPHKFRYELRQERS